MQELKINNTVWISNGITRDGKLIHGKLVEIQTFQSSKGSVIKYVIQMIAQAGVKITHDEQYVHASAKEALIAIGDRNDIDHGIKHKVL